MSAIIGVIAIAFLILGILLFFGLRSLQKQTDTTLHFIPQMVAKNLINPRIQGFQTLKRSQPRLFPLPLASHRFVW